MSTDHASSSTGSPIHSPRLSFEEFYATYFAPLHRAELAREEQWQDEAFADTTHTVCGLQLRGMTAHDLLLLHGCDNPFVTGGPITPEHVAQFLALLVEPAPRGWWARRRFFRYLRALPYAKAVADIRGYRERMFAFADLPVAPGRVGQPSSDAAGAAPVPMSFLAPLVIGLAAGTGWSEADILSLRLDKLFQYRRALHARDTGRLGYAAADHWVSRALTAFDHYRATGETPPTP